MLKKLLLLITVIVVITGTVLPAFAANSSEDSEGAKKPAIIIHELIFDKSVRETDQTLVKFTKPDKAESSTYKKSYTFSGYIEKSDICVHMARLNRETGKYESYYDVDEDCSWTGFHGFIKVFPLNPGENKIKVVAYNSAKADKLTAEDYQVSYFTINRLKDNLIEDAIKNIMSIFSSKDK